MKTEKIRKLVLTAMFCALVFTATWFSVPAPMVGNVNLGDCMVLLSAWVLGGIWAALAAGVGAAMCDLASGYVMYAPATFVIKALMVLSALLVIRLLAKTPLNDFVRRLISAVAAELVMIGGYFCYEAIFLKYGIGAAANIPFNAIQGVLGMILALLLYTVLAHANLLRGASSK